MSNATPVTVEVLENMMRIAAMAARARPGLSAEEISTHICKLQKLVVSLRKKIINKTPGPEVGDKVQESYDWMRQRCEELARAVNGRFEVQEPINPANPAFLIWFGLNSQNIW